MIKRTGILTLCIILSACNHGGGHSRPAGAPGAPGKSAYEIWLEQGNTGTEQDFLDSLVSGGGHSNQGSSTGGDEGKPGGEDVYSQNMRERLIGWMKHDSSYHDFSEKKIPWPKHGDYMQYNISESTVDIDSRKNVVHHYTYNEKELTLGNYWLMNSVSEFEDGTVSYYRNVGFDNREANNANVVHDIASGSTYTGGTFATAIAGGKRAFLTGDVTLKYNPTSPEFVLDLDNYYKLIFSGTGQYGIYNVSISGSNLTGESALNIPTGELKNVSFINIKNYTDKLLGDKQFLRKDGVEEVLGTYNAHLPVADERADVTVWGAFGATKQ